MNKLGFLFSIALFSIWPVVNSLAADSFFDQKVSIELNDEPIATGLQNLQRDYKIYFSYVNKLEQLNSKKTVFIKSASLDSALNILFDGTNITYYELYDQVVLIEKKLAAEYQLDVFDSITRYPDTVRVFNITYLEENSASNKMSVADLWRALMMQKIINDVDSQLTWVRYDTLANADTVKITIDSVRKKQNLRLTLKERTNDWQHELTLAPDIMITQWQMSSATLSDVELTEINEYGPPEISFSAGLLYGIRYKFISLQTGLELNIIKRDTRHTETLINIGNNNAAATRVDRVSSQYTYLGIPLLVGVNLGWENIFLRFSGGVQINRLAGSSGASFYSVYDTIYYNITLDKLYDADNNLIENQEIELRPSFTTLRLQAMSFFQMNDHFNLMTGIIYRKNQQSIYASSAPVEEVFSGFSFSAGIQFRF